MKHIKFESRDFKKKEKRLCNICKHQLGKKEKDVHKECRNLSNLNNFQIFGPVGNGNY